MVLSENPVKSVSSQWWIMSGISSVLCLLRLHSGDYDQEMCQLGHTILKIRGSSLQILVREIAGREDVHHIGRLLAARYGYVYDTGGHFLLQVGDESGLEVSRVLQNISMVASTGQGQKHAVLLVHLFGYGNVLVSFSYPI